MERIKASAIRYIDLGVISVPQPGRHHDIIWDVFERYKRRTLGIDEQGFVTNTGRFVGRTEALQIARAAGQVGDNTITNHWLFSEDVW